MVPGATAVSGFPPPGRHSANLEATNPLVKWAYTNLADPRWPFTRKYLTLRQALNSSEAQTLGMFNKDTWAVYLLNHALFVKRTTADPTRAYPDFGCSSKPSRTTTSSRYRNAWSPDEGGAGPDYRASRALGPLPQPYSAQLDRR